MTTQFGKSSIAERGRLITRRVWLLVAAAGAAAAFGLRGCHYSDDERYANLDNLTPRHGVILAAIVEAMLPPYAQRTPAMVLGCVRDIDAYMTGLHGPVFTQLRGLLTLVEQVAPLAGGQLRRFSDVAPEVRASILESLKTSDLELMRLGFRALKALVFLAYYRLPAAWQAIGYEGPHHPAGSPPLPSWDRYDALLAGPRMRPK